MVINSVIRRGYINANSIYCNRWSVTEYCKCSSLQENTSYADLYTTLLNKISSLPKGKEFVLRELIATPPALIGRWFYENVNKRLVKNVEHIGKAEGGVEKYKKI